MLGANLGKENDMSIGAAQLVTEFLQAFPRASTVATGSQASRPQATAATARASRAHAGE